MRGSIRFAVPAALMLVAAGAGAVRADHQQVPMVKIQLEQEIAAPPAAIWAHMTSGKSLVTWCPVWKSEKNAAVNLARVGDVLDFTDEWGNGGRSVVTYLSKEKELRVAHEPNDGSYLCQAKLTLVPKGGTTIVRYLEQYTDESPAKEMEATQAKTEGEMRQTLMALKKQVEKK
ncbi:MAG: hypothetical protein A2W00_07860 [Candidatus Eisenbacteria bacterium RBG_16_71_46]|nr:MAG: hypothetical protein A2W00_07860 [Candidatus Eisenbacteria bacterium RBG_16_71_46]